MAWCVRGRVARLTARVFVPNKMIRINKKHATQEKKRRRRRKKTEGDLPQIQEWEILQKDDIAEREMPVPVREQKGGRGWFSWLFGTSSKKTETAKEGSTSTRGTGIELNVSDCER